MICLLLFTGSWLWLEGIKRVQQINALTETIGRHGLRLFAGKPIAIVLLSFLPTILNAGLLELNKEPIHYKTTPVCDRIYLLKQQLEAGTARLEWDEQRGWLPSVLKHLQVPAWSQTLVFSKTSLQINRISPATPRAIYFNDDTYVGWVKHGDVIELSAVDPEQGAIFYVLPQKKNVQAKIIRDQGDCLSCHSSSKTKGVPGYLVRSVFVDQNGQPYFGFGSTTTDHTTPFDKRFGGWYVSGMHGRMRHQGNVITRDALSHPVDADKGANLTNFSGMFPVDDYLEPGSDIVALMILEHQSQMHNLITYASYECRHALYYQQVMNQVLKRPVNHETESTRSRIVSAGEKLLRYMLFSDEYKLQAPVRGLSEFSRRFSSQGPRDGKGRSLRDLDLERRIFRYPCSFLIYSESFNKLPLPMLNYVEERLIQVLQGKDHSGEFVHLSPRDRAIILEILVQTKAGFLDKVNALNHKKP